MKPDFPISVTVNPPAVRAGAMAAKQACKYAGLPKPTGCV